MNKQNKPSYLTAPNIFWSLIALFLLYRIGLSILTAHVFSKASLGQQQLARSQEIASIIDRSFDNAVSYLDATFDINEYIKPSLHYIYDAYVLFDQDKPATPLQDSAVLYYYHFQEESFFAHASMDYDTLSDDCTRLPLLS